ncbi:Hypothetical_protein [Hexamita inflata]|uniref:Hypothetical_protein n=1 Tax=Hexamita inflata TaxID=28002 RepID=A0AA86PSL2_9EUKA|nr:Hypothetical protein HINF_LOCUS31646 [Hexamita inflata]
MPTQQRSNRALTESSADQFHLIRQHYFQKLVLASQFLFARYFLRLAREVVPLYWHCLVVVAFDALFHQLDYSSETLQYSDDHYLYKIIVFQFIVLTPISYITNELYFFKCSGSSSALNFARS